MKILLSIIGFIVVVYAIWIALIASIDMFIDHPKTKTHRKRREYDR